jgi:cytochrome P450
MEWGWFLPEARYGETWRRSRKILDHGLGPGAVTAYRPMQAARAYVLLSRILESPGDWEAHIEL